MQNTEITRTAYGLHKSLVGGTARRYHEGDVVHDYFMIATHSVVVE